jgi:hypothetical protein
VERDKPPGHDPEKGAPVFSRDKRGTRLRGDHAQIKEIERDDDSKKRHHALAMLPPDAILHREGSRWKPNMTDVEERGA